MHSWKYRSPVLLLFLSFIVLGFSSKMKIISSSDVLLRSRLAILSIKNINYDCRFAQKFAGGNDTLKTEATVLMEMKAKDSLLGCDMKMTSQFRFYAMNFKTELFYNGKHNIALNHTKKKATVDTMGIRGRAKPILNMISQNFPTASLMNHYTEKLPFEPFFKNTNKIILMDDEQVGAYLCYKLKIQPKNTLDRSKITILYIDKQSFLPVRRIDSLDVNNKYQYSDFTLSAIKINEKQTEEQVRKMPVIPKDYNVDYFRMERY